ncbi:hypothetical protein L484_013475 [Morus notabilis]|uniref:Uncharacterized protein n=1 Tax=Morus notabilis TaxID=981085 RepID=W9QDW3_9ROSA|nr:hypothetical protein L484_013475 [Morus notabilis]
MVRLGLPSWASFLASFVDSLFGFCLLFPSQVHGQRSEGQVHWQRTGRIRSSFLRLHKDIYCRTILELII